MFVHEKDLELLKVINPNMQHGPWIAGGACINWFRGREVELNDIDVYCADAQQRSLVIKNLRQYGFWENISTENAITLNKNSDIRVVQYDAIDESISANIPLKIEQTGKDFKTQIICKQFFSSPQEIIDTFDFSVCQIVTDGFEIFTGIHTLKDLQNNILRIEHPSPALFKRLTKYIAYGFNPLPQTIDFALSQTDYTCNFEGSDDY